MVLFVWRHLPSAFVIGEKRQKCVFGIGPYISPLIVRPLFRRPFVLFVVVVLFSLHRRQISKAADKLSPELQNA
jgi:hypothetical protein